MIITPLVLYKKSCLNFQSTHPLLAFQKNSFSENFGKISSKALNLESFIQVHLQAFLVCERTLALKSSHPFQKCKRIMPTLRSLIDEGVEQQMWFEKIGKTNSQGNWYSREGGGLKKCFNSQGDGDGLFLDAFFFPFLTNIYYSTCVFVLKKGQLFFV